MMTAPKRALPIVKSAIRSDPDLLAAGWQRRFLADQDRKQEAIELYASLGYEVRAEPLAPVDFSTSCGDCPDTVCRTHVLIYTRRLT